MKTILTIILISAISLVSKAQLYSVTTLFKNISNTTASSTLHEYIEINNLSGAPLPMKWETRFGESLPFPSAWTARVTDPDSIYNPLVHGDTASFILMDTLFAPNQLIIGVTHNGVPGISDIVFNLYPLSDPSDSTLVGFNISVTQAVGVETYLSRYGNTIFPNPSSGKVTVNESFRKIELFDAVGRQVLVTDKANFDISNYANGSYFLKIYKLNGEIVSRKLMKH